MTTTAVKMIAEGRVGGYLVVWGTPHQRDLHGEFFTPETDFALDWFAARPALYQHGMDGALKAAVIGTVDTLRPDDVGIWAEAQLDLRERYVQQVQRLVEQGVLAWSSGSLPHLAERDPDGRITRWPLIEGSLTPTPAEPRYTDVQTIKQAYKALGINPAAFIPHDNRHDEQTTGDTMTENQQPQSEAAAPALKRLPLNPAEAQRTPRIAVGSPYDHLSADDLLHGYVLLRNAKTFRGVSEQYANALAHKVGQARLSAVKADELAYSTQTGYGDEWVPDLWSGQIWARARQANVILPLFRSIEMPSNPFELPAEGADPTVYFVGETADEEQLTLSGAANPIPDSKIATTRITLNAKKLALRTGFSAELVEDAIVPVLNLFREQSVRAIADSIDHVLLNGDTAAAGNVNLDGGTPAANVRYKAFDGLRKTALANAVNANAAPSLTLLRSARFQMPGKYAARPSDLAWIVDGSTYAALLNMTDFLTMDKVGPHATAITGQIGMMDGAPVLLSGEMPDQVADTGKISSTAEDNTKGSAICVYRPGWYVGYRRRVSVSVDYLAYTDSYQLTATVRLAFNRYDATTASALRNVTV